MHERLVNGVSENPSLVSLSNIPAIYPIVDHSSARSDPHLVDILIPVQNSSSLDL